MSDDPLPLLPPGDLDRAHRDARKRFDDALRLLFARWADARKAPAEERSRAKEAIDEAEEAFERARDELESVQRVA